jgi:hypothetical protein
LIAQTILDRQVDNVESALSQEDLARIFEEVSGISDEELAALCSA